MKIILALSILLILINCKENSTLKFDKIIVQKEIKEIDSIKKMSKFPEIINNKKLKSNSLYRTAMVTQCVSYDGKNNFGRGGGFRNIYFSNYTAKSVLKNDTLEIEINNNNGEFGNGILVKIFEDKYVIKNFNPNTLHNKISFLDYPLINEKVILNTNQFKKSDSIFGCISYKCMINSYLTKEIKGCFRTKIN